MEQGRLIADVAITGQVLVLIVLPERADQSFVLFDSGIYRSDLAIFLGDGCVETIPALVGQLFPGNGIYPAPVNFYLAAKLMGALQSGIVYILYLPGAAVLDAELLLAGRRVETDGGVGCIAHLIVGLVQVHIEQGDLVT